MLTYSYVIVLLLAKIVLAQEDSSGDTQIINDGNNQGYDAEVVTEWTNNTFYNEEQNAHCVNSCKKTCVEPCPDPQTCTDDQVKCGEEDHPEDVWPECKKDEKCVPKDCECMWFYYFHYIFSCFNHNISCSN